MPKKVEPSQLTRVQTKVINLVREFCPPDAIDDKGIIAIYNYVVEERKKSGKKILIAEDWSEVVKEVMTKIEKMFETEVSGGEPGRLSEDWKKHVKGDKFGVPRRRLN